MAAAYPISFLPYTHNQILHAVNLGSLPAWFSLLVLPRWHMTRKITAAVAVAFLLRHPAKILPVLGTNSLERIAKISDATKVNLTRVQWFQLYEAALGREVA